MKMCCTCWSNGSIHSGFPPRLENLFAAHLEKKKKTTKLREVISLRREAAVWSVPLKVVPKPPQTLQGAQVLVQAPLSVTRGPAQVAAGQDHALPAAADISWLHVDAQLREQTRRRVSTFHNKSCRLDLYFESREDSSSRVKMMMEGHSCR